MIGDEYGSRADVASPESEADDPRVGSRIARWEHAFNAHLRGRSRRALGYFLLALVAYVPPLLTAPGKVAADTKQYLYLNPGRLLVRAASMWDPNVAMGTVTHQTIGYLFP